jgi:DNA invertase Pin-like site-specific DNA recombinase
MKVALYARVSRDDLHCENQKLVLDEWCKREGVLDASYFFEEVSSRKTRPEKEKVLQGFRSGTFDTIVCVKLDRFARSLQELVMDIEGIVNSGGRFVAISNGMDFQKKTYNASQQLMLNIFGSFAQFEREMIRERTLDGLARARAQGRIGGRPKKTPPVSSGGASEESVPKQ